MQTLTHLGKLFTVAHNPNSETEHRDSPYIITSPQGRQYVLCRNKPKPELLFALGFGTGKLSVPRNWWFTDKDGVLKSLTP